VNAATLERSSVPARISAAAQDRHRLLVLRHRGSELLVAGERPPFTLPSVTIPRWERMAENVVGAVKKRYGISAICLFAPELSASTSDGEPPLYQVMESREGGAPAPPQACWVPVHSLSDQSFADGRDSVAILRMLRQISEFRSGEGTGPFAKPGWIEELLFWIQSEIAPYGLCLSGEIRQLNASPTFALLRLETNGRAVWFKAVGEPNLREFAISVTLSRHFPGVVPTMIATRPSWHGWLTTEFPGRQLDEVGEPRAWELAAQTLAELQIGSAGKTDDLLGVGCRDVRVGSLLKLVDPFLDVMSELIERQPRTPPPILSREQLARLGRYIKDALSELAHLDIPDTLGQLDFNPGNILCSSEQCVFLDWAEAYVGAPFLTFQYLLEHQSQTRVRGVPAPEHLVDHYASRWVSHVSSSAVAAALRMMPLLAAFACAATSDWTVAQRRTDERFSGYLRSLTRRMLREAEILYANRTLSDAGSIE
jgi:hypothetical protein